MPNTTVQLWRKVDDGFAYVASMVATVTDNDDLLLVFDPDTYAQFRELMEAGNEGETDDESD